MSVIIFSCDKKKVIEDDLNVCIDSFSLLDSENQGKKLESNIDCQINAEEHTISLTVPHTAELTGLKFNITPCEGVSISPASGEEVDFEVVIEESTEGASAESSTPKRYKKAFTLTKGDKSQEYTVYITKALASDCSITSFKLEKSKNDGKIFGNRDGDIVETTNTELSTITLHVSDAATLDGLTPTIVHTGASIAPGELTTDTSNNTTTVNYTVTDSGGKTKVYVVKYIKDLSSNNRISVFSFTKDINSNTGLKLTRSSDNESRAGDVIITDNNDGRTGTIAVKASSTATITALTPTITKHASATISPDVADHDYSNSKVYTVTAEDGQTKEYTVSVSKILSNDKGITSFMFEHSKNSFSGTDYSAENMPATTGDDDVNVSIAKMPHTVTDLTSLKPTIVTSDNATVSPATEVAQDFTRGTPVVYIVTAQDGTTRNYNVTIGELSATANITSFKIKREDNTDSSKVRFSSGTEVSGNISSNVGSNTIDIVLDGEDDTTVNLKPEIALSAGASVSPASGVETTFTYGTAQTYTVTAEDNSTQKIYSVTVKSSNSKMKSFKFKTDTGKKIVQDVTGTISGNTVTVKVPHDAVLTNLTPYIELYKGATITTPSGGATTAQDFSSQKTYTVTAQDGTTSDYNVTVTKEVEPKIESFTFSDTSNTGKNLGNNIGVEVKHSEGEIIVKVPYNATLTDLTPTVAASIAPSNVKVCKGEDCNTDDANSTAASFEGSHTSAVKYSAVGPAGGRKVYSVKVYKEPTISEFKFESSNNSGADFPSGKTYIGTVTDNTIAVTVANTVDVANLKATISGDNFTTLSNHNISFSGSSSYSTTITVQNEHLSSFTKTYNVTLTKEAVPELSNFSINADDGKGIKAGSVTTEITQSSGSNTGTIKLKFDHKVASRHTDIDLTNLSYTSEPGVGHTLTPTSPLSGQSIHGQTFTLTTTLGSTSEYTVEAVKGPFIKSFKFGKDTSGNNGKNLGSTDIEGTIDHENNSITVALSSTVKKDSDTDNVVTLTPTIELGGDSATIDSASGNSQAFTSSASVNYKVTGADGMEKTYAVTVTRAPSTVAQITKFEIESSNPGNITHPGNGTDDKGRIVVPVSATGSKTPAIEKSDYATVSPNGAQTFSSYDDSKEYIVTAEDATTTKTYEVYIYDSTKTISDSSKLKVTNGTSDISGASASINANTRVITITVPESTDLSSLTLTLTDATSSNLSIEPTEAQDFSNRKEVKYTLKESSDVKGHYWVKVQTSG
ncbi:pkd domain containing protein [Ichthyobacterium seriolicida]|uniref:Pkd domain containing protein n=1 Tax=Ichthyobacterium seriolicida TaxID=242600 RepID=A0A1J1DXV9_9FLAO|nr:pkd domain containing protein [Ichthyobacterium seriolicida]